MDLLVSLGTNSRRLVVFGAVDISTVMKGAILSSNRSTSPLILKMPMKTGERAMLLTLVLQKQRTLVHAKFFEIPRNEWTEVNTFSSFCIHLSLDFFVRDFTKLEGETFLPSS